jgi:hypothetical protein
MRRRTFVLARVTDPPTLDSPQIRDAVDIQFFVTAQFHSYEVPE